MILTSQKDPAGVAALLESLQSSQAWKDAATTLNVSQGSSASDNLSAAQTLSDAPTPRATFSTSESSTQRTTSGFEPEAPSTSESAVTVEFLLAQLQSGPPPSESAVAHDVFPEPIARTAEDQVRAQSFSLPSSTTTPAPESKRGYSYKQALPVLAQLSQDPHFTETIIQVLHVLRSNTITSLISPHSPTVHSSKRSRIILNEGCGMNVRT